MRTRTNVRMAVVLTVMGLLLPTAALAQTPPPVGTFTWSPNMTPVGYSARNVPLANAEPGAGSFNSDLAFWGDVAVQGTYAGFRLIDISDPSAPEEIINWEDCNSRLNTQGNQGDVIIYENLVIRSWNSPAPAAGSMCGDMPVPAGEEGVHIIDISDPEDPEVIGFVDIPCGSHTETLVPDLENDRLIVVSNPSSGSILGGGDPGEPPVSCRGMDLVEIPLDAPEDASYLKFLPAGDPSMPPEEHHPCHDSAAMLGDVNLLACAGGEGTNVFDISDPENPVWLYHKVTGGVGGGHSAAFTFDGEVLIIGHEPGGGSAARCQSGPPPRSEQEYTYFFLDARTGESIGQFAFPRPQSALENCTVHNYNVVPTNREYVLVSGNYQSGISVVNFSDPDDAEEIAFADPAPLVNPDNPTGIELGGDWSTYWYNGFIYESDITRGVLIWELDHEDVAEAQTLDWLNPQTAVITFATFPGASKDLEELFEAGGITEGLEAKVRNALEKAQEWLTMPKKGNVALSHLERAIHLLLWQADVIENKNKPNQGDPDGLRALAATIQQLLDELRAAQ